MNKKFFNGKNIFWYLSRKILGIVYETDANTQVMWYNKHTHSHFSASQNANGAMFKIIDRTNRVIQHAACLQNVHILKYQTSCPTAKSARTTMVNALNKNFLRLPEGKFGNSTKISIQLWHPAHQDKNSLEAEPVWALGALCSLQSKTKLAVEKRWETHYIIYYTRELDRGLYSERDRHGKRASWISRESDSAGVERYDKIAKCRIDNKRAWKYVS